MVSDSVSQLSDTHDDQEQVQPSDRPDRGMLVIAWFIAVYLSSVLSDTSSSMLSLAVSGLCLQFLGEVLGERCVTLAAIAFSMIVSAYGTYIEAHLAIFIFYICTITICGGMFFLIALRNVGPTRKNAHTAKGFAVANLVLRQLLDNGIIPMDDHPFTNTLLQLHRVLFSLSFIPSVMSLWLQTIGIPLLTACPVRRGALARREAVPLIVSILYWSGAAFLVAYVLVTIIVSPSEMSIIAKVACVVFGACRVHTLFG